MKLDLETIGKIRPEENSKSMKKQPTTLFFENMTLVVYIFFGIGIALLILSPMKEMPEANLCSSFFCDFRITFFSRFFYEALALLFFMCLGTYIVEKIVISMKLKIDEIVKISIILLTIPSVFLLYISLIHFKEYMDNNNVFFITIFWVFIAIYSYRNKEGVSQNMLINYYNRTDFSKNKYYGALIGSFVPLLIMNNYYSIMEFKALAWSVIPLMLSVTCMQTPLAFIAGLRKRNN
jgi:hypothetical protein